MRNKKKEPVPENAWIGTMKRRALTLYMLNGEYLIRTRSSLTGEKVKRAACFKNTMRSAGRLGSASSLAAAVYNQLPEGWKLHSLYRTMTGIVTLLIKAGEQDGAAITTSLWKYLEEVGFRKDIEYETIQPSTVVYEERGLKYKVQGSRSFATKRLSKRGVGLRYKVQSIRSFATKPFSKYLRPVCWGLMSGNRAFVNTRVSCTQRGEVVQRTQNCGKQVLLDSG
ncbi:MAG: hypothetical protein QM731_23350 [Chitinophagaceae bacterium]